MADPTWNDPETQPLSVIPPDEWGGWLNDALAEIARRTKVLREKSISGVELVGVDLVPTFVDGSVGESIGALAELFNASEPGSTADAATAANLLGGPQSRAALAAEISDPDSPAGEALAANIATAVVATQPLVLHVVPGLTRAPLNIFPTIAAALVYAGSAACTVALAAGDHETVPVVMASNQQIVGDGFGVTRVTLKDPVAQAAFISAAGTAGSTTQVTANVAAGAVTVDVASAAGIAKGDWVLLCNDSIPTPTVYADKRAGEYVRVTGITGTTLQLQTPTTFAHTTANSAFVRKINPVRDIALSGFTLVNPLPEQTKAGGIGIYLGVGVDIRNVKLKGFDNPGISLNFCAGWTVADSFFEDFASDDVVGRYGYGVLVNGASAVGLIDGCQFVNVRHATTTDSQDYGQVTNLMVSGCQAIGTKLASFDTHAGSSGATFSGCVVRGGRESAMIAFQVRAQRTSIIGCRAYDMPSAAVYSTGAHANDMTVSGCQFERLGGDGFRLDGNIDGLSVHDNYVTAATQRGVNILSTATCPNGGYITGNKFRTIGLEAAIVLGAGVGIRVEDNRFRGAPRGVVVGANASSCNVYGNTGGAMGQTAIVQDSGTSTRHRRNINLDFPVDRITLAANGGVSFDLGKGAAVELSGSRHLVTLQANATSSAIVGTPVDGDTLTVEWAQDATGGRTYAWFTGIRWAGGAAPAGTTTANKRDIFVFVYDGFLGAWVERSRVMNV